MAQPVGGAGIGQPVAGQSLAGVAERYGDLNFNAVVAAHPFEALEQAQGPLEQEKSWLKTQLVAGCTLSIVGRTSGFTAAGAADGFVVGGFLGGVTGGLLAIPGGPAAMAAGALAGGGKGAEIGVVVGSLVGFGVGVHSAYVDCSKTYDEYLKLKNVETTATGQLPNGAVATRLHQVASAYVRQCVEGGTNIADITCPITGQLYLVPYKLNCPHTFDLHAIMQLYRRTVATAVASHQQAVNNYIAGGGNGEEAGPLQIPAVPCPLCRREITSLNYDLLKAGAVKTAIGTALADLKRSHGPQIGLLLQYQFNVRTFDTAAQATIGRIEQGQAISVEDSRVLYYATKYYADYFNRGHRALYTMLLTSLTTAHMEDRITEEELNQETTKLNRWLTTIKIKA